MGYVRTAAEVAAMRRLFTDPKFLIDGMRIEFETNREFIRSVLPPCLEPGDRPTALATVGRWQSWVCGEFDTSCIYVAARYGNLEGYYNLTMLVSGDMPVSWGREFWGEAKKVATMGYYQDGDYFYGFGERNGVRLIELGAEFERDLGPSETEFRAFEIKAIPSADGKGLEYDPLLLVFKAKNRYSTMRHGKGRLTLRGTIHDPVDTIPIVSVGEATHINGEALYGIEQIVPLTDREAYIPYVYGRNYDDLTQYQIPLRYIKLSK